MKQPGSGFEHEHEHAYTHTHTSARTPNLCVAKGNKFARPLAHDVSDHAPSPLFLCTIVLLILSALGAPRPDFRGAMASPLFMKSKRLSLTISLAIPFWNRFWIHFGTIFGSFLASKSMPTSMYERLHQRSHLRARVSLLFDMLPSRLIPQKV